VFGVIGFVLALTGLEDAGEEYEAFPGIGDLTFEVGFVLAAGLHALFGAKARRQLV
jgi:hypothetical protein